LKKKVLILLASRGRGGVEKRFINYVKYLATIEQNDFEYTLLINKRILLEEEFHQLSHSDKIKLMTYQSINIKKIPRLDKYLHLISFYFKVLSLSKKLHFDIVHFASFTTLNVYGIFKNSSKLVTVYSGYENELNRKINKSNFQKTISNAYYDCLSPLIAKQLNDTKLIKQNCTHTSPGSFIDMKDTNCEIATKENSVVFLGGLRDQKGLGLLIALIQNWRSIQSDYKLYIFGTDEAQTQIEEIINKNDLNDKVKIAYTNDPKSHLRKSKIFLSLQKGENYPSQSLLEAMACKNAVVATDVGLTHRLVDELNGVRIESSTESLITGLNAVIDTIETNGTLLENSRKKVIRDHTVEKFHEYLQGIYTKIS
jgi:GalNAc-alpha-(1->4)-GalNAc-alpha-(1->3)-diNAcBac-PP-undecaprenol alpha-1,4-N-acetyl-D-galactosaminyltransferase